MNRKVRARLVGAEIFTGHSLSILHGHGYVTFSVTPEDAVHMRGNAGADCVIVMPEGAQRSSGSGSGLNDERPDSSQQASNPRSTMKTISELQAVAYQQSAAKGFHDDEPTEGRALQSLNAERIALMHSELSEALEELRNGRGVNETYYPTAGEPKVFEKAGHKPEGVPSEMADVVIRVLDFCGANGIDLEAMIVEKLAYNNTRPRLHNKSF